MESNCEVIRNGKLLIDECDLCNLPGQLFKYCKSDKKICVNCILKHCNYENDGTPCMNCVVYGFFNYEKSNYPGDGKGRCYDCHLLPALDIHPTIENYRTVLTLLGHSDPEC